jgi:hypothetical protein
MKILSKESEHEGLIEMVQDEEHIWVHPTTVKAHVKAGWELANRTQAPAVAAAIEKANVEAAQAAAHVNEKLVRMFKTGKFLGQAGPVQSYAEDEFIEVNPTAVKSHEAAGWTVVDEEYLKEQRDMFLHQNPFCADPYKIHGGLQVKAVEVALITPRREDGSKDEFSNLKQSLCRACYTRKLATE